jgi:endonuclease I
LHAIIAPHTGLGFDGARDRMFVTAEIDVDSDGMVECIYTGTRVPADETRSPGDGPLEITTEHTWPRSDGADVFPAEGDLHHLAPATSQSNNERASLEFGEVSCSEASCPFASGGSLRGPSNVDGTQVFEVRLANRGDVARAHFYFSVRYETAIGAAEEAVLRRWHCEDPPSERERARNDAIEVHQDNRNPFVDRPELAQLIADF